MCGLVGVFGDVDHDDIKYFKNALIADYVRGVHSTGIAIVDALDVTIHKKRLNPCDFLDLKEVSGDISLKSHVLMGHNRHATTGSVNSANAHPFEHGDVTLAHNGTLSNKYALERLFKAPRFETDSELVTWLLDNYQVESVIKELEGAFALTWWDGSDDTFNFIHNGEREFNILVQEDKILYASEAKMLEWIATRHGIKRKGDVIYEPKVGMHFKCKFNLKDGVSVETKELELAPVKKTIRAGGRGNTGTTRQLAPVNQSKSSVTGMGTWDKKITDYFLKEHNLDVTKGSTVYAFIDTVTEKSDQRCEITGSLTCEPYTPVKVYWTVTDPRYMDDDVYCIRGEVTCVTFRNNKYEIILKNDPSLLHIVSSEEDLDGLNDWQDKILGKSEVEEDTSETYFHTHGNRMVPWEKFKSICDKDCAMCGSPIDAVEQAVDQDCKFISEDDAICSVCAGTYPTLTDFLNDQETGVQ